MLPALKRLLVAGVAVLVPSACSLVVSVPDLTSGREGPPAPDAAEADGGPIEHPPTDAAGLADAGCDAGFCDDFEHDMLAERWSVIDEGSGVTCAIDTAYAASGTRSLRSRLEASDAGCLYARVLQPIAGSYTAYRFELSVLVATAGAIRDDIVAAADIASGSRTCALLLGLEARSGGFAWTVREQVTTGGPGGGTFEHDTTGTFQPGTWNRLGVAVDYVAGTLDLTSAGTPILSVPLELACPATPGEAHVQAGLYCSGPATTARELHVDDVVFLPR